MKTIKVPKGSSLKTRLEQLHACDPAQKWVGKKSLKYAWNTCPRADWMVWLAYAVEVPRELLVLAACDCVRAVLDQCKDEKGRDLAARGLSAAEQWCAHTGMPTMSVLNYGNHIIRKRLHHLDHQLEDSWVLTAAAHAILSVDRLIDARKAVEYAQYTIRPYEMAYRHSRVEVPLPLGHVVAARIPLELVVKRWEALWKWSDGIV